MSVGDVHSDARGSGARFNDDKAPLHLIPLGLIADSFIDVKGNDLQDDVRDALDCLGSFQTIGNPEYLLIGLGAMWSYWRDCAAVFDYGRKKYAEWNWAKGMAWSIPLACAARHALAILEGEEIDAESGLPHVGHLLCNMVMLRTFVDTYPEGNDLPPPRLFARIPAPPDYDPASVAFRHGDGVQPSDLSNLRGHTAPELAAADGASEYGHPITPGCAVPTAEDKTHGVFNVDLTRNAFFYTTDGVYHTYAEAWRP